MDSLLLDLKYAVRSLDSSATAMAEYRPWTACTRLPTKWNTKGDLTDRSIMALEVELAVMAHKSEYTRSRFYLRDPLPYDQMAPDRAADFSEAYSFELGATKRAARLQQLKATLRSELPPERRRSYTARWVQRINA
jgi:hypothetical protein